MQWVKQCTLILGVLTTFALLIPALTWAAHTNESANQLSFTSQCPLFLKQADDFAHECLANARKQTRYWHPDFMIGSPAIKETASAYFGKALPGSHFALGCTLASDHTLNVVGIYYSTNSNNFKIANTAPLNFIDFNGNVRVSVDGKVTNFVMLRQLGTDFIPLHFPSGAIKNCEDPRLPDGELRGQYSTGWVTESESHDQLMLKICQGSPGGINCHTAPYIDAFPSADHRIIFQGLAFKWIVTSGGDLLINKDYYTRICSPNGNRHADNTDIIHEACDPMAQIEITRPRTH
ncbi:MAG TPA: hypothetical protein VMW54_08960 [Terriglobia bacterium]|nr:hypothetical protein [Terriglobia bacterium]